MNKTYFGQCSTNPHCGPDGVCNPKGFCELLCGLEAQPRPCYEGVSQGRSRSPGAFSSGGVAAAAGTLPYFGHGEVAAQIREAERKGVPPEEIAPLQEEQARQRQAWESWGIWTSAAGTTTLIAGTATALLAGFFALEAALDEEDDDGETPNSTTRPAE